MTSTTLILPMGVARAKMRMHVSLRTRDVGKFEAGASASPTELDLASEPWQPSKLRGLCAPREGKALESEMHFPQVSLCL